MQEEFNRNSLDATLARIETKLDEALRKVEAHEARIACIEWRILPVVGVIGFLGFVIPIALRFLK